MADQAMTKRFDIANPKQRAALAMLLLMPGVQLSFKHQDHTGWHAYHVREDPAPPEQIARMLTNNTWEGARWWKIAN